MAAYCPPALRYLHTCNHLPICSPARVLLYAQVAAINERFVEARDEIEYAKEDAETVYFNESAEVPLNRV